MTVQHHHFGRRERKAERTRREIVRAASELVIEDGYERATIARIAERADLATRTVTTRFASKDDIFFEGIAEVLARVEHLLTAPGGDVVDRLRAWIAEMTEAYEHTLHDRDMRQLRSRAIEHDPDLRAAFAQHFDRAHDAIARRVATDTGDAADAVGPQMVAGAAITMIRVVERLAAEHEEEALPALERGYAVLSGALSAL